MAFKQQIATWEASGGMCHSPDDIIGRLELLVTSGGLTSGVIRIGVIHGDTP